MITDFHTSKRQEFINKLSTGNISKKRLELGRVSELLTLLDDEDWQKIISLTK